MNTIDVMIDLNVPYKINVNNTFTFYAVMNLVAINLVRDNFVRLIKFNL